jgi:hypothetical protein
MVVVLSERQMCTLKAAASQVPRSLRLKFISAVAHRLVPLVTPSDEQLAAAIKQISSIKPSEEMIEHVANALRAGR